MMQDVFLTGIGQTAFGEQWDLSLQGLIKEAIDAAIDSSECTALDIDMIIVANMIGERVNAQAHLGSFASSLLPHHPPAIRVEAACASGSVAAHTACGMLESGKAETVLIVGAEKMTDASTNEISAALMGAADSEKDVPTGLTFPGIFGLVANRYMHDYKLTRDELSLVSAVHHKNATTNPFAQFKREIPVEAISKSTPVADPLRLFDCSPISDGAAACILSTKFESDVRIAASQVANDALSLAERASLTSFAATRDATKRAMEEADVVPADIDCVELHDCFSIAAIVNLEDMGFAEPGRGVELYKDQSHDLAINPSGGLKACGHPVGATGVKQMIDTAKYLRSNKKEWGIAHNIGGVGATCGLHILQHAA